MKSGVARQTKPHPVLYAMLFMPMGITNGYVTVALAYLLSQVGVSVGLIAGFVGLSLLPSTWRAVWAPLVDTTFSVRGWFLVSTVASGWLMAATALIPVSRGNFGRIELLAFVFSLASTLTTISGSSLLAHGTSDAEKGRAGGWSQAGNLGGTGIGGGLGLWLAQHAPLWIYPERRLVLSASCRPLRSCSLTSHRRNIARRRFSAASEMWGASAGRCSRHRVARWFFF